MVFTFFRKNECQACKLVFHTPRQLAVHKSQAHRVLQTAPQPPNHEVTPVVDPVTSGRRSKGSKATQVSEEEVAKVSTHTRESKKSKI